jgi:hypothetical protein
MSDKAILFALLKDERDAYLRELWAKRRMAHEYLNHFLVIRRPDEWVSFYGTLCEYIGILYHYEEALEKIILRADWDEKNQQWLMDEKLATAFMLLTTSEMMCREDLLFRNVSLGLH